MADEQPERDDTATFEERRDALRAASVPDALALLAPLHPADQAELIAELEADERAPLLPRIPPETMADILAYLREEPRREVVTELEPGVLGPLLDLVEPDVAVDILQTLPDERAQATQAAMRTVGEVAPLLRHPDNTAGGKMTTDYVAFHKDWTVEQALSHLRRTQPTAEQVFYLYVVDDEHRLEGVVSLRLVVVAAPEERISDLMTPEVMSVRADLDQEEVAREIQHYNFIALPVVDEARRLLGVVTVDDLMDVAEEEATEDMYRMVGLTEDESLLRPMARSVAPRLSWLLINLFTALAAAGMVATFEDTIQRAAVLAVFMPVIAGMGGNAGIQTITLMVRSIALRDVELGDVRYILQREVAIGLLNGVVIGLLLGVLAYLWKGNVTLGVIAGLAMLLNMATAVTVGVLVPLTLKAFRLDPALASGVLVTTFTDVLGFFFFLGLATLMIERIA